MEPVLIGLDLGTSALKVGVYDLSGQELRISRQPYSIHAPQPGWAEQEPADWWAAACLALREAVTDIPPSSLIGLGLSGQAPSHVLLGPNLEPLGRAIVWSDRRAAAEAEWLSRQISPSLLQEWTGYTWVSDASQPAARLLWLKAWRPEDWSRCVAIVQPKDLIAARLVGHATSDVNSSYGLFHPSENRYHPDFLALMGVPADKLPPVVKPTEVIGRVTPRAAEESGLPAGLPVVSGTIDAWCNIIGSGGAQPNRAVDIAGTSEVVGLITERLVDGDGVHGSPLVDSLCWIGGPMQNGASVRQWVAQAVGVQNAADDSLDAMLGQAPAGSNGLLFLPYLQGERAPLWDSQARGAWVGLTQTHTPPQLLRAAHEGVAFAICDILRRCEQASGIQAEAVYISGGGARSDRWNQIKASVLGRPVIRAAASEAACLGAAVLAATGLQAFPDTTSAAWAMVRTDAALMPSPKETLRYDALFTEWQKLYQALRPSFVQLCELADRGEKYEYA